MKPGIKNMTVIMLTLRHQSIFLQNVKWHNQFKKKKNKANKRNKL